MLKNHLLVALRALRRERSYALINVFGLAVGIACCLLIGLYARREWAYDRFHADPGAVFRLNIRTVTPEGEVERDAGQPPPLAETLAEEAPEVAAATHLREGTVLVRGAGPEAVEEEALYTTPTFFDVFSFPLARGDARTALARPDGVVLSEAAARRYFGETDPVGQPLALSFGDAFEPLTVTGVVAAPAGPTAFSADLLLPVERAPNYADLAGQWTAWGYATYVRLTDAAAAPAFRARLPALVAAHYGPMVETWRILGWIGEGAGAFSLELQPLAEVHLDPDVTGDVGTPVDPAYPGLLAALALAILLVACVNFTTLAVGRAARRAKEVGVRKVLGARRGELVRQFWAEAVLASLAALGLGVGLATLALPAFNGLLATDLALTLSLPGVALGLGLALFAGTVAGLYPALYLSRFQPARALKGQAEAGARSAWVRPLVVAQFACSIACVIGAFGVARQLGHLRAQPLGFDAEHVVVLPTHSDAARDGESVEGSDRLVERFRAEVAGDPAVVSVGAASALLEDGYGMRAFTDERGAHDPLVARVDHEYLATLGLEVVAGRPFSPAHPADVPAGVVVNEALVEAFGWTDPVGQVVTDFGSDSTANAVVGVVRNFRYTSPRVPVAPVALYLEPAQPLRYLFVRFTAGGEAATVARLQAAWARVAPGLPFQYRFLDEEVGRLVEAEARLGRGVQAAALLAVLLSCLGLFGLAAARVAARTKEIGIRKALGASATGIAVLLSKDFARLVLVAFVLAAPAAYLALDRWLAGFAVRAELGAGPFVAAGLLILAAALLATGYHTARAAAADPVKALRYE
jgi:putative ABC transport system permease protein